MNVQTLRARYLTFIPVTIVAAIFSAAICVYLLLNFAYRIPDPLTAPQYVELREALRERSDDESLKDEIRQLDLALREDYFRRRQITTLGTYLLLGGIALGVVAAKSAATLRRRLPRPIPDAGLVDDPDARRSVQSLWSVGGLALGLFIITVVLIVAQRSVLPGNDAELAALFPDESEPEQVVIPAVDVPETAPPEPLPLPSFDEIHRNWTRFRGSTGLGVAEEGTMPTNWDVAENKGVLWRTPVPLPGKNSPILWDDQLFLSGATEEAREVYCFDAQTGELRWQKKLPDVDPGREPIEVSDDTGFAAPTMTTDGLRVYAIFANGDAASFDMRGEQVWFRSFGNPDNPYGHASSLLLDQERLIVQLDQGTKTDELSKVYALDSRTGETLWEVTRQVPASWTSPLLVEHDGQSQIITCADPWVIAYLSTDGTELWRCKSLRQDVGPSPVAGEGVLFVANEYPGASAIRLGGQGDVTETHVEWEADIGIPDTSSPLLVGDMVLMLASYGTLTCYDAKEGGEPLWEEDFDDNFQSSPSLVGDHVLLVGESGACWVIQPTRDECTPVGEGNLGEDCVASPAFHKGRMYLRGAEHLFCLGEN